MNPQALPVSLPSSLEQTLYPPSSRYHGLPVLTMKTEDGQEVAYLGRRFLPATDRFFATREHTVTDGDRVDRLAAVYLGDPEQFWRLCDANGAMFPDELTQTPGRRLLITLPEGITPPRHV